MLAGWPALRRPTDGKRSRRVPSRPHVTIVLSLINQDQAIQLSDRLVSSARGPLQGEANKTTLLVTANGRLAVGLTGLASVGTLDLTVWILEALVECGKPDYDSLGMIQRLQQRLETLFRTNSQIARVPPRDRRLSLMFSGFLYHHDPPLAANCLLTNFQDVEAGHDSAGAWSQFRGFFETERLTPRQDTFTYVQRVGAWPAMYDEDGVVLREMLAQGKPVHALIERGVALIRRMADRPEGRSIGKQVTSLVVPRNLKEQPSCDYHTEKVVDSSPMVNTVFATGNGPSIAYRDIELSARNAVTGEATSVGFPRVGRNVPCPCGSRKKFKWCHGKTPSRGPGDRRR